MPGLINSHHHGKGLSHLQRGIKDGPLEVWIHDFFTQFNYGVNTYLDTLLSGINQIESGITCTMHHFYGPVDVFDFKNYTKNVTDGIRGNIDSGIRVGFAPAIHNQNTYTLNDSKFVPGTSKTLRDQFKLKVWSTKEMSRRTELYFKAFDRLHGKFDGYEGRVHVILGPANVHWCSDDLLKAIKRKARILRTGIHTHLLETKYQSVYGKKFLKSTPTRHLARLKFLGPEVTLAHSIWLKREDLKLIRDSKATCVHNPSSNLRLSSGIAPVLHMRDSGIHLAMGTDGTGINDDEDVFQEMRMVSLLHRVPGIDSYGLSPRDIFDMATIAGAKVTGWPKDIGALEVGRKADIITVDTRRLSTPYLSPKIPIIDALVLRGKGMDVDNVMINGEIVIENQRYLKHNKLEIYDKVREWPESDVKSDRQVAELKKVVETAYKGWDGRKRAYRYNEFT